MQFFSSLFALLLLFSSLQAAPTEELFLSLANRGRESQSDAILIMHNGCLIFEYRSDAYWQPIDLMSITKSVVALVVGILIDEGAIESIDTPVYKFYPEWEQGNKRLVTIRHLLNHTSGIGCDSNFYQAADSIQFALCAEIVTPPGSHFAYNDMAVNLLSGIVEKASDFSLSEYAKQKLFDPMGIENVAWQCDETHHDYAMAHLTLTAPDLAKIGELVLKEGLWRGQRLVSQKWIRQMTDRGQLVNPFCGHLWWIDYHSVQACWDGDLLKQYERANIAPETVKRLHGLQGQVLPITDRIRPARGDVLWSNTLFNYLGGQKAAEEFNSQVACKQLSPVSWSTSGPKSYAAYGIYGQQLIVFPAHNLVAVRQARPRGTDPSCVDTFPDFGRLVEAIIYCQGY